MRTPRYAAPRKWSPRVSAVTTPAQARALAEGAALSLLLDGADGQASTADDHIRLMSSLSTPSMTDQVADHTLGVHAGILTQPIQGLRRFVANSPTLLDAINQYPPVVAINAFAAVAFMIGFVLFGIAMTRTPSLPRVAGILVAVGAPTHLVGFGLAQIVSPSLWPLAIVGSVILGAGLGWPGYRLWEDT